MLETPNIGLKIYESTDLCNYLDTYNNTMYLIDSEIAKILQEIEGSSALPTEELEELKKKVSELTETLDSQSQELWILQNRFNSLYEDVSNLSSEIDGKMSEEAFNQFVEVTNNDIYTLQTNLSTATSKIDVLETKNTKNENNISELQTDTSTLAQSVNNINKQLITDEPCVVRNFFNLNVGSGYKLFNALGVNSVTCVKATITNENYEKSLFMVGSGIKSLNLDANNSFQLNFEINSDIYYPKLTWNCDAPFFATITISK